jgi:hypothetical protein
MRYWNNNFKAIADAFEKVIIVFIKLVLIKYHFIFCFFLHFLC